jgi:hypothetical protein
MKMKLIALLIVVTTVFAVQVHAQFRQLPSEEPSAAGSFVHPPSADSWLGFFNPENLTMHQSYSMSYSAFGSQGLALGRFTNSMEYKINDKLNLRADVSLQHSPYSTFDRALQNSMTGIFLDRAELIYKPADNMFLRISYRQVPAYYGYNSPYMMGYPGLFDDEWR